MIFLSGMKEVPGYWLGSRIPLECSERSAGVLSARVNGIRVLLNTVHAGSHVMCCTGDKGEYLVYGAEYVLHRLCMYTTTST